MKRIRILAAPKGDMRPGNPYVRLLYGGMSRFNVAVDRFNFWRSVTTRYDATHVHWPEKLTRSETRAVLAIKFARLAIALAIQRSRGGRVIWTCHNLKPHEGETPLARRLFRFCFLLWVTDVIYLTATSRDLSLLRYPELQNKRAAIIPHGHYRPIYPSGPNARCAREKLGLPSDSRVLLFFGQIRSYKQVPLLIEVFRELDLPDVDLVVAGLPATAELEKEVRARAQGARRVHLRIGEIPEGEVPSFFAAANIVVCPFREILNSGSVLLALSLNRPVLAPAIGSLPELEATVGAGWVQLYRGAFCQDVLAQAIQRLRTSPQQGQPDLSAYDWEAISEATYLQYLPDKHRSSSQLPVAAAGL